MKKGWWIIGVAAFMFVTACMGYFVIILFGNYAIDERKLVLQSTSRIVDEEGNEITKMYTQNREPILLEDVPVHVQQAFLAIEDERFYKHHGMDGTALIRALYQNIRAGEKVEGGSTITQQVVKNVFLTNEKTWSRKIKELAIAMNLERRYTKKQILELYLNQVYFGHGIYGIKAASLFYFQKQPDELDVAEGALLAGLMKAPGTYSPILHPQESKERRNLVLTQMHKTGSLSAEEVIHYQGRTLSLRLANKKDEQPFLSYIDMVFQEAADVYHLSYEEVLRGGYTFVVGLDKELQQKAYDLFQDQRNFPKQSSDIEGAFVLMDSKTGAIQAALGGRKYVPRGWNRVYQKRQPGSTIKPILVYGPAMDTKKYKPYSLLTNEKQDFNGYMPRNYNDRYSKEITMYDAVKDSANVPAVWLLNEIGLATGKKYLELADVAIETDGLSAALGGLKEGVSPIDLVKMYRAFGAKGRIVQPHVIRKILNQKGEAIAEAHYEEKKLFSEQTAWYMTRMLEAAVKEGTAKVGRYDGALAGKTGTTSISGQEEGARDAWFVGFTPSVVGAVWMGYDRTDASHYIKGGSSYPTTLFKKILMNTEAEAFASFEKPDGVKQVGEPIRMTSLKEAQMRVTFTPLGLFTAKITWNPLSDKRVQYRIYKEGSSQPIATVTGKGFYDVKRINIFSVSTFYVVPYNPQTKQEGEKTKAKKR
ncbi:transglycosylase domain-containing protein [Ectobacillus antri]